MLRYLSLANFKSAKNLELKMRPLTVLAGLNGSGKSTILQSLALLKQSLEQSVVKPRLQLRGRYVNLGRSQDVTFENAADGDDAIKITLDLDAQKIEFFAKSEENSDTLQLEISGNFPNEKVYKMLSKCQFIQADRLTPATQYFQASTTDQESGWLGCRGEFTVDYLHRNQDLKVGQARHFSLDAMSVSNELYKQVAPTDILLDQLAGWMQQLSPGVRIRTDEMSLADAVFLQFEYTGVGITSVSRRHRPMNVGFGLTYSLPIVVACLSAPTETLLLLENPEAHLHPQGQAALGRLLAKAASDGVQIVVETHSDHLLNGIRLAVKRGELKAEDTAVHYFIRDIETGESKTVSPQILPDGQLTDWPEGFFDQWDRSLDALLD